MLKPCNRNVNVLNVTFEFLLLTFVRFRTFNNSNPFIPSCYNSCIAVYEF